MVKTNITSTKNGLSALSYAINDTKPHDDSDKLITHRVLLSNSINCSVRGCKRQMSALWSRLHANRIQAYRVIQSFSLSELDPHNPEDVQTANKIGLLTAKKLYPNHQVIVATQADGEGHHLHNHIIVNALDFTTLKSLRGKSRYQPHIAKVSDEISESCGVTLALDKVTNDHKKLTGKVNKKIAEIKIQEKFNQTHSGKLTFKETMRRHLDQAFKDVDLTDFNNAKKILAQKYFVDLRVRKRGVSYRLINADQDKNNPNHYKGTIRGSTLGNSYSKDKLEKLFRQNRKNKALTAAPLDHTLDNLNRSIHHTENQLKQLTKKSNSSSLHQYNHQLNVPHHRPLLPPSYHQDEDEDPKYHYLKNGFYIATKLLFKLSTILIKSTIHWAYHTIDHSIDHDDDGPTL